MNARKTIITAIASVSAVAICAGDALAQSCDFDGVVGYFMGAGIVKAALSILSVAVMLVFALTRKSIPGFLGKALEIVGQFLGRKSTKP